MHISDESEEEKTNEPEEREALEKDENQIDGDEKIGEGFEKSNEEEEEDSNVCEKPNLTELILIFEPFIFLD